MPTIYGYTDIQGNLNIKGFGTTSTTNSLNIKDSNSNTLLYVSDSGIVSGGPLSYSFSFGGLSSFVDSDYFVIGSTIRGENTQLVINGGAYPQIIFNNSIYGSDMYILSGSPGNHLEIGNTLGGGKFTYIGDRNIGVGFDGSYYSPAATVDIIGIDNTTSNFAVKVQSGSFSPLLFVRNDGNIGIGTASPEHKLEVVGTVSTTGFRMTNGAQDGYVLKSDGTGNATWSQKNDYKSYVALLSQTSTNAPTAIELENTFGFSATFSYVGIGSYELYLGGQLTSGKTFIVNGWADQGPIGADFGLFITQYSNTDKILLNTWDYDGSAGMQSANNLLNNTSIEIRVYP